MILKGFCCLAMIFVSVSCTNAIDDYYLGGEQVVGSGTVLEYLESDPDFSEFVELIEQTGMREKLSGKDLVTVWAPTNGQMPESITSMSMTDKVMLVGNHISITTIFSRNLDRLEIVGTTAGKFLNVARVEGTYRLDGVDLTEMDKVYQNGVVHKIGGWIMPKMNLHQFITSLDDRYSIFKDTLQAHNTRTFDKDNSPIVGVDDNGQIFYDSVFVVKNDLIKNIDLSDESIRYTLLIPDNQAFEDMYAEKTAYLQSLDYPVTHEDSAKWNNWMMKASLHKDVIAFTPSSLIRSINNNEVRTDYNTVGTPTEMSNGRVYSMSKCYVPKSIYFKTLTFNPYYLRKEILDAGFGMPKNPGAYDSYLGVVHNVNSRLIHLKFAAFFQYTTEQVDSYYQFKSCSWDTELLVNTPLNIMPGNYKIMCRLVSQLNVGANETDALDFYQVHSPTSKSLIANVSGIVANTYDLTDGAAITNQYEVTGKYAQLDIRVVIPGKFAKGEKRRICIGQVTLIPNDNY